MAGIHFQHNSGAYGESFSRNTWIGLRLFGLRRRWLARHPAGEWDGLARSQTTATTMKLYRNNRNGTFTDVTKAAGLDEEMYGMGVAVGDYNNDGFPDIFVTCVGQSRLFRNTGKGTFVDVTKSSGLREKKGLSTSALWFDYDRDGLLDLLVCNYVHWSAERDVFCSLDGKNKSYCTPEAYRGDTCWLYPQSR